MTIETSSVVVTLMDNQNFASATSRSVQSVYVETELTERGEFDVFIDYEQISSVGATVNNEAVLGGTRSHGCALAASHVTTSISDVTWETGTF